MKLELSLGFCPFPPCVSKLYIISVSVAPKRIENTAFSLSYSEGFWEPTILTLASDFSEVPSSPRINNFTSPSLKETGVSTKSFSVMLISSSGETISPFCFFFSISSSMAVGNSFRISFKSLSLGKSSSTSIVKYPLVRSEVLSVASFTSLILELTKAAKFIFFPLLAMFTLLLGR